MKISIEQIEELIHTFEANTPNEYVLYCHYSLRNKLEKIGCVFKDDKVFFKEKSFYFVESAILPNNVVYLVDRNKLIDMTKSVVNFGLSVKEMQYAFLQAGAALSRMGDCFVTFAPESVSIQNEDWWDKLKKFFKQIKSKINERFRTFKIKRRN